MKTLSLLALASLALLAAGCGGTASHKAAPTTTAAAPKTTKGGGAKASLKPLGKAARGCVTPSAKLVDRIRRNVVLDHAQLTRIAEVASPALQDTYLVSAQISGGGAPRGMVATWVALGQDGKREVLSLDSNAALISQLGAGVSADPHLVINLPGAFRSRVCSGGQGVSPGTTAPPSGGGPSSAG